LAFGIPLFGILKFGIPSFGIPSFGIRTSRLNFRDCLRIVEACTKFHYDGIARIYTDLSHAAVSEVRPSQ
jgi:hypothetical protein